MKRAKIMLTALSVVAVVGVALAFKAKPFTTVTLYTGIASGSTCATQTDDVNTTTNTQTGVHVKYTTTTATPVVCIDGYTTTAEK